jgi:co-chaperonin GroES (HSP10)
MLRAPRGKAIVKRFPRGSFSDGGTIFIPDIAKEKPLFCEVMAVGEHEGEWEFEKGDTVVVFNHLGKFEYDGVEYLSVTDEHVLGRMEDQEDNNPMLTPENLAPACEAIAKEIDDFIVEHYLKKGRVEE